MKFFNEKIDVKYHFKPGQMIAVMYFTLILVGAILLSMPFASKEGTKFIDAFFIATSAVCVTGLTPLNTAAHFTMFGKMVIIILIQIGGLGIMTVSFVFAMILKSKISLREKTKMIDATNALSFHGIVKLSKFIFIVTIIIELMGAVFFYLGMIKSGSFFYNIFQSMFYSISAFCNAGFDLSNDSLIQYQSNILINIVITLLIMIGGIGFFTIKDIATNKLSYKKYSLQTKAILFSTMLLIIVPFIYYLLFEFSRHVWGNMTIQTKILASWFQTITPRTAGFYTVDLTKLSANSTLIMIMLMIIGGAPTSTAGGFKVTTFFVLISTIFSRLNDKGDVEAFNRRFDDSIAKKAIALFTTFSFFTILSAMIISLIENVSLFDALFETASAIGTVGLTKNLTPSLNSFSKIILIFLMFFGRIGCLTFLSSFRFIKKPQSYRYPIEDITIG